MLGAGLGGYGGYASPEGLADAHGMGYGDNEGGMGGGYNSFMRGLIEAYSKYYGGNSSLLGKDWGNTGVFGGPMLTSGPTDVQGAMIGSNVPTDANPGGYLPGPVSNTPHNSQLAFVDLMDPNLQDPMGGGIGGTPAGGYSFGGMTPQNSNGGLMSEGGGERPWWLEGTNNGMGMMNPATGGWNDWDAPYTGNWPPNNIPPQLEVNPGMPYIRPTRPKLAYENAYDQWDEQGGFGGGM